MPTGYTADIKDGISFEQFVWNCARAFGAANYHEQVELQEVA